MQMITVCLDGRSIPAKILCRMGSTDHLQPVPRACMRLWLLESHSMTVNPSDSVPGLCEPLRPPESSRVKMGSIRMVSRACMAALAAVNSRKQYA